MDNDRLQQIKYRYDKKSNIDAYIKKDVNDLITALEAAQAELEEVKSKAWKTVDLEEGNMLVFVGVHVVAWQQEWGQPKVGFTRWNDDND